MNQEMISSREEGKKDNVVSLSEYIFKRYYSQEVAAQGLTEGFPITKIHTYGKSKRNIAKEMSSGYMKLLSSQANA